MKLNSTIILLLLTLSSNVTKTYSQFIFKEEPQVRVKIIYTLDTLSITFNDNWNLCTNDFTVNTEFNKNDSLLFFIKSDSIFVNIRFVNHFISAKNFLLKSINKNGSLKICNVPYGIGWWWQGVEDRVYEGDFDVTINENNKFNVILSLPLEEYLCGVVPYEIGSDAPIEALKSQVIAARSETVEALLSGKYRGANYDLCADVECQVFAGNNKRTTITDQAVQETRSLCLFYGNEVIGAYYASNCGGMSESVENVWPGRSGPDPYWSSHFDSDKEINYNPKNFPEDWIKSNPDVFCNPYFHTELPEWSKKNFRWQIEMTNDELSKNLNEIKEIGILNEIKILERGNSGRIIKARFLGSKDSLDLNSELEIRKIKKPPFRSSCFIFDKIITSDNSVLYKFNGAGWGHGVGMCQSGAIARAFSGQNFYQILKHYFPGTTIKGVYDQE